MKEQTLNFFKKMVNFVAFNSSFCDTGCKYFIRVLFMKVNLFKKKLNNIKKTKKKTGVVQKDKPLKFSLLSIISLT